MTKVIKCKVEGVKMTPCKILSKAIDGGSLTKKAKGLFMPYRINIETGEEGHVIVQLHSGGYIGRGVALNFCPFCGEKIVTWGEA
ncbi:hypothetical protein [Rosenbergiella epipactidis]|uniref:hypothetical protein n=1 Tax=Rosenbergiella epipactidis TaxID=1544694 RepID=UPI001F4E67F5|nr:hypothetical protein [Rosenbergiella epipactidis]